MVCGLWYVDKLVRTARRLADQGASRGEGLHEDLPWQVRDQPEYVPGHGLLAGKTVLVTAAAGTGIGFAAAKRCIEEGARRRLRQARAAARRGGRASSGVHRHPLRRHRRGRRCRRCSPARVDASSARIDVLVNNAGLGGTRRAVEMTDEQWNARARRHPQRHLPLHARRAARTCTRSGARRDRQQRVGGSAGGRRPGRRTTPRPRPA